MCHLVTWFNPVKPGDNSLNLIQTQVFETFEAAASDAEQKTLGGCSEVRVWALAGTPTLVPTVEWKI